MTCSAVQAERFENGQTSTAPVNPGAPDAPFGVKATPMTGSRIDLSWTQPNGSLDGFKIERSDDAAHWTEAGRTIPGTTEFPITGLKPATAYWFRVMAYNAQGDSPGTAPIMASTCGNGLGLSGVYYHRYPQADKIVKMFARQDPYINFNWNDGIDGGESSSVHNFLIVWTGQIAPLYTGKYTITTNSDDGVRLWINGQKLIDNWTDHPPVDDSITIDLQAGKKYDIRLGYFENDSGGASISLSWAIDNLPKEIIPQSQLYPLTAAEEKEALKPKAAPIKPKKRSASSH